MLLRSFEVSDPAFQNHGIELLRVAAVRAAGGRGHHIFGNLTGQNLADLLGLAFKELLSSFSRPSSSFFASPALDNVAGRQRILAQFGAGEDTLKGVEVAGGDGIVLVVVTLGACNG